VPCWAGLAAPVLDQLKKDENTPMPERAATDSN
jgi:hypothetical protein